MHFVPIILSFSLSPDCPQQSLCCFNGCRNVCIPEQSVQRLKQYSNKDTWRSQYEENNSKVRSRLEHGFQKRYPELSGQEKNDYPGTVTYQSKKLLTVKSVERATKKNSNKKLTVSPHHDQPKKSNILESISGDKGKVSSSAVDKIPSSLKGSNFSGVEQSKYFSGALQSNIFSGVEQTTRNSGVAQSKNFSGVEQSNNFSSSPTFHVAGKDSGGMLPTGATLDVTEQQRSRAGTKNSENVEIAHKGIENGLDGTGSTKRAEPGPKLRKDNIFKERERIARFQRKSTSLTKSTFEQGLESAKSKTSPSEDHLASVKDQKLSKGPKRRLLPGTLLLLPQEEYKYIEYPATPPASQSDSPCPGTGCKYQMKCSMTQVVKVALDFRLIYQLSTNRLLRTVAQSLSTEERHMLGPGKDFVFQYFLMRKKYQMQVAVANMESIIIGCWIWNDVLILTGGARH